MFKKTADLVTGGTPKENVKLSLWHFFLPKSASQSSSTASVTWSSELFFFFWTDLFDWCCISPWHAEAVGKLLAQIRSHSPPPHTGSQTGSLDRGITDRITDWISGSQTGAMCSRPSTHLSLALVAATTSREDTDAWTKMWTLHTQRHWGKVQKEKWKDLFCLLC